MSNTVKTRIKSRYGTLKHFASIHHLNPVTLYGYLNGSSNSPQIEKLLLSEHLLLNTSEIVKKPYCYYATN